jgi:hypothetical protein
MIGHSLDTIPLLASIAETAVGSDQAEGSLSFVAADGSKRTVNFARIAGTDSRLILSIDETEVSAAINRESRVRLSAIAVVRTCFAEVITECSCCETS